MWNFVNSMGHPGHMGLYNQKRDFSIHVQSVPIVPGKAFTNPNFVNKHHPSVHSYQNNHMLSPFSRIDSSNLTNSKFHHTNSALLNSSQSLVDKVKENHIDAKTIPPNCKDTVIKTTPVTMCTTRKHNKRNRRNRRRRTPAKNSKQNVRKQQIKDMMDIDLEMDSSVNALDISMSPKVQNNTFSLNDFIIERPNNAQLVKDSKNQYDSDEEELVAAVISVSPPNITRFCSCERQLSITESEDSFIVFESGTDEELEFSEASDEEDETAEDEVDSSSSVVPHKKVRFADDSELCEVHPMVQWSFAYQQARKGPWEGYARDRDRFGKRIIETEKILSPVFTAKHRANVYQERFKDTIKIP